MAKITNNAPAPAPAPAPVGEGTFIVHVQLVSKSETYIGRVNFDIEEEIVQLDENGNEKKVNQFSLQNFALRQQLKTCCKEYCKYLLLSNNTLDEGQLGMLLFGATLTINRVFCAANTPRKYGEGKYERDTYTTEIVKVEINKEEAMIEDLKASIREAKALSKVSGNINLFA